MANGKKYIKEAYEAIFLNDFHRAINAFKMAIEQEPANASYYYKLSVTYSRSGRMTDALDCAKMADSLNPCHSIYRLHFKILQSSSLVGSAIDSYTRHKDHEAALKKLYKAISLNPLHAEAHYWVGVIHYDLNNDYISYKHLVEALRLQPVHRNANDLLKKIIQRKRYLQ